MNDLLVNKATLTQLNSLSQNPPHAVLLVGPLGIGKLSLAKAWAQQIGGFAEIIEPEEKGTITIELVRNLYRKTSGKQQARQVIIIDHAESMSTEAQNAFLKLLEEPRQNVTFVLTSPTADMLLQTITSRVQVVLIGLVLPAQLKQWALQQNPNLNAEQINQLIFIAQGRPATLAKVMQNPAILEQYKNIMQCAKKLLSDPTYDRLASVNELTKDRGLLIATLEAMATMTSMQLSRAPTDRWINLANGLEKCLTILSQNGNPRAQLVNLFLSY